jgi:hypothetical protein
MSDGFRNGNGLYNPIIILRWSIAARAKSDVGIKNPGHFRIRGFSIIVQ